MLQLQYLPLISQPKKDLKVIISLYCTTANRDGQCRTFWKVFIVSGTVSPVNHVKKHFSKDTTSNNITFQVSLLSLGICQANADS